MSRVSVIIPCYNDGDYLREAVESALHQEFQDLDVIVVDDGSTDTATLAALTELSRVPRVRVMRQENSGPSTARNHGVQLSDAEYFMPLDADDIIEPQYVGEAVHVLDGENKVGAVYCKADLIGDATGLWRLPDFDWSTILVHNLIFNACLFRKDDWLSVGGYDESMRTGREDHDFILKILGLGRTVRRLDEVYFHYRQRNQSRNAKVGGSRELLVASSAKIFRNNVALYEEKAEELFEFIYRQQDQITDLRHRYAALERLRTRFPSAVTSLKLLARLARVATKTGHTPR